MRLPKVDRVYLHKAASQKKILHKTDKDVFTVLITSKFLVSFLFDFNFKKGTILQYCWMIIHKNLYGKLLHDVLHEPLRKERCKKFF